VLNCEKYASVGTFVYTSFLSVVSLDGSKLGRVDSTDETRCCVPGTSFNQSSSRKFERLFSFYKISMIRTRFFPERALHQEHSCTSIGGRFVFSPLRGYEPAEKTRAMSKDPFQVLAEPVVRFSSPELKTEKKRKTPVRPRVGITGNTARFSKIRCRKRPLGAP
jgi:hypothetical protein